MIIILGTTKDEHVHAVSRCLRDLATPYQIVDHVARTPVQVSLTADGTFRAFIDHEELVPPVTIWDRRKMWVSYYAIHGELRSANYTTHEWNAFGALLTLLYPHQVFNPFLSRYPLLKPYQQVLAAQAGFRVPPTIVTNDTTQAFDFLSDFDAVAKSLSEASLTPKGDFGHRSDFREYLAKVGHIMTATLDSKSKDVLADSSFQQCPHFLQQRIEKRFELRVVVVGQEHFAFHINSDDVANARLDWRVAQNELSFTYFDMPDDVVCKLKRFMHNAGLFSGSFDLIVDRAGDYWFLECNQDGQWSWLDVLIDGRISQAFAMQLKRAHDAQKG